MRIFKQWKDKENILRKEGRWRIYNYKTPNQEPRKRNERFRKNSLDYLWEDITVTEDVTEIGFQVRIRRMMDNSTGDTYRLSI